MISIIVPHYDDIALLGKHLPRMLDLLQKSKLDYEVIVSDDCSPIDVQKELNKLQENYPLIKFLLKEKNEGFGPTVNRAVREAKGEIVFVLKNDVLPEKFDFFSLMLKHFSDRTVFAVSAAAKTDEENKSEIRGQGIIIFFRGFFFHFRTRSDFGKWLLTSRSTKRVGEKFQQNVNKEKSGSNAISAWADGGSSAFRRDTFLKLGGFNSVYAPFYWEDTDLGYFAWKAGYRIEFEPNALLIHEHREGSIAKHYSSEELKVMNIRNQFNFVWSNGDLRHVLSYIFWLPYHYLVAIKNGNLAFIKGHIWALSGSMGLFITRANRKCLVKLSDGEALKNFEMI